ncbi:MAG: hypothetical protein ABI042_00730 [Verrucomicrobiota bacterium]
MTPEKKVSKVRWCITGFIIVLAAAAVLYLNHQYGLLKNIHTHLESYHWLIVFLLVSILPVFGFSVFICYVVIGSKFGGGWGLLVVALATTVHLVGSHWIATSFLRRRIEAYIARKKYNLPHVPDGENVSVSLMTAIIPGLPYFVRNYLLALAGIPLKTYFWICWPVYLIRSMLAIFASDFSADFTSRKVIFLVSLFIVKVGICAYIIKRLRNKNSRRNKIPPTSSSDNLPV